MDIDYGYTVVVSASCRDNHSTVVQLAVKYKQKHSSIDIIIIVASLPVPFFNVRRANIALAADCTIHFCCTKYHFFNSLISSILAPTDAYPPNLAALLVLSEPRA